MRRQAIALLGALLFAVLSVGFAPIARAGDVGGPPYTWTLSASAIDPYVNVGDPSFGILELYLWAVPSEPDGWQGACFDFEATGMVLLAMTPTGGIQITDGCFYAFSCPSTPVVVAVLIMLDLVGEICMVPSPITGTNCTVDCGTPPQVWENSWIGYTNSSPTPCSYETWAPCGSVSVEPDTWGRIKAEYR